MPRSEDRCAPRTFHVRQNERARGKLHPISAAVCQSLATKHPANVSSCGYILSYFCTGEDLFWLNNVG